MPLPDPDYLTDESFYWDGQVFKAALLTEDLTATGIQRTIRWGALDSIDRRTVHELIMEYASRQALAEVDALSVVTYAAFHVINYGGQLSIGISSRLVNGVEYKAQINVNGTINPISIIGVPTDTVADVITKIITQLTGATAFVNPAGNLEINTALADNTQSVVVTDQNLFSTLGGGLFKAIEETRHGINDINDVFDLNFRGNYASYTELLIGKLRYVSNNTNRSAKNVNDIYYNHGTKGWFYVSTDTATPTP